MILCDCIRSYDFLLSCQQLLWHLWHLDTVSQEQQSQQSLAKHFLPKERNKAKAKGEVGSTGGTAW